MNDQNELTDDDIKLMNDIDRIIFQDPQQAVENTPINIFCSLLANVSPQSDPIFKQKVWTDLVRNMSSSRDSPTLLSRTLYNARQTFRSLTQKHRIAVAISSIILFAIILATGLIPPTRTYAINIFKQVILGKNVEVVKIELITPNAIPKTTQSLNMWEIKTDVMNIGGNLPEGMDPTVRNFISIRDAQSVTNYMILQPTYLPDGYSLKEIKIPPTSSAASDTVLSIYSGPGNDIYIYSAYVGPGAVITNSITSISIGVQESAIAQYFTTIKILTEGSIEETNVNNEKAAWIDNNSLVWYSDGVLYEVGGIELNESIAVKIAESIR